jgi:AmiR/NasT family two-component response regulator
LYIHEAGRRGIFAYIVDADAEELQSAIDITLQRLSAYSNLQGAFGRRAVIEQAKGILMARHAINQERAFEALRLALTTQRAQARRRRRSNRRQPPPAAPTAACADTTVP